MLERCAEAIEQVILPNLTETFAAEQARYVAFLLRAMAPTVEERSQGLREENEGMRELLRSVVEALHREKALSQNAVRTRLIERLSEGLEKAEVEPPDVGEQNRILKGALVETIRGLDALTGDLPAETMSSLRQQIRVALRQQLDNFAARRQAWMNPP